MQKISKFKDFPLSTTTSKEIAPKDVEQNCFISKVLNIPITSEVHFEF
jgi:hypothetical protein